MSNTEAIVCSQFPAVAKLEELAEAAAESGIGAEAAQKVYDAAVASHTSMIDPQIFSAVIFALIGFCLVTGIEMAGKMMSSNK